MVASDNNSLSLEAVIGKQSPYVDGYPVVVQECLLRICTLAVFGPGNLCTQPEQLCICMLCCGTYAE